MDFGRIPDVSRVDFSLPPDFPRSLEILNRARSRRASPRVHIGCPVWGVKSWLGKVYPLGTPTTEFLPAYARQFNTIELNITHYRVPDPATVERWRESVPSSFRFCPKFHQEISHDRLLMGVDAPVRAFCESLTGLGENLGPAFLQLPPHFDPGKLGLLARFFSLLPRGFKVGVEFRHPAWFSRGALRKDAWDLLEGAGSFAVMTDVAGRRDVMHASFASPLAMVRFVGNELHPTDYQRLDHWAARIQSWIEEGLEEIHFIVHQPGDVVSPDLIRYMIPKLNERCGLAIREWQTQDQGRQLDLFGTEAS